MINRFLAIIAGITAGIVTGILPGVHPNLIAALTAATSIEPLLSAIFLTAMAGTNTIIESISTAFLAPDPDKAGSACQQFLREGKAPDAARLLILGGTIGALLSIGAMFAVLPVVKQTYTIIQPALGIILGCMSMFFILQEETLHKKMCAFFIAINAGALGWIVLNNPVPEPLFLLLTGMYAIPALVRNIVSKQEISAQHTETITELQQGKTWLTAIAGSLSAGLLMLLPSTSPSHAAYAVQPVARKPAYYLILLGAINSADLILSLGASYYLGKERNGVMATIAKMTEITLPFAAYLGGIMLLAIGISALLGTWLVSKTAKLLERISYVWLCSSILVFILLLTIWLTGLIGIIILLTSGAIGILCQHEGVSHKHCMNALTVPVIGYFL